jgi:cytoskeletal protein CcmA (bactofilin family)
MLPNFKKTEGQQGTFSGQAVAPRPHTGGNDRSMSIIGPDLTITGDLISKGELRVDGEIEGDIKGVRLVIGEHARVTGNITGEDVILHGEVMGSVRGLRVSLQSTSRVQGDVYHQALVMEQGAFFEGTSNRSADPLADKLQGDIESIQTPVS